VAIAMTTAQRLTFKEYLDYDDGSDNRYELIDGRLIALPPESEPNTSLANYLFLQLVNLGISFRLVQPGRCEIQVPVLDRGDPANRFPDLVLLREEHLELTQRRLTITVDTLPPLLAVEVVSPGQNNRDRDFVRKRRQYAARGIPEYWLVDLQSQTIFVLELKDGDYVEKQIRGEDCLTSTLPELQGLQISAEQILSSVRL
jgi:Uma2 family endonuclease